LGSDFLDGANSAGLETLKREAAIAAFREHEQEGLCHMVWTFQTPFIAGICNCDIPCCLAMRLSVKHAIPIMFRAEYVAKLDLEKCTGCGKCLSACQFKAISQKKIQQPIQIDLLKCYGCGVCRSFCPQGVYSLKIG